MVDVNLVSMYMYFVRRCMIPDPVPYECNAHKSFYASRCMPISRVLPSVLRIYSNMTALFDIRPSVRRTTRACLDRIQIRPRRQTLRIRPLRPERYRSRRARAQKLHQPVSFAHILQSITKPTELAALSSAIKLACTTS